MSLPKLQESDGVGVHEQFVFQWRCKLFEFGVTRHYVHKAKNVGLKFSCSSAQNIRVIQGQDKLKYYADPETWNKSPNTRVFCGECGSNLFLHPSSEDAVRTNTKVVTFGTLDEDVPWGECRRLRRFASFHGAGSASLREGSTTRSLPVIVPGENAVLILIFFFHFDL